MSTMAGIYIDYLDTLNRAAKLEELAARLEREADRAESEIAAQLSGSWTGQAAEQCLRKSRQLAIKLKAHAVQLRLASWGLRQAAWNYYHAEMAAHAIFGM